MAKEWILNMAVGRWGLNKKNRVGPVSSWIRECAPKDLSEWQQFYFKKLKMFLESKKISLDPKEYLASIGKRLYIKVSEVIHSEVEEVTESDCLEYIYNLVINRTYEGYLLEKHTIYGQLSEILQAKIEPAPDKWDRVFNVDFFIKIGKHYIGLQIKPISFEYAVEYQRKWRDIYQNSHNKFTEKFGGRVFVVLSIKEGRRKVIFNKEVIEEIKKEISRLQEANG
ncbi:MAG: MjaI family restriction endonuclease [Acidobacteria bacterium]|nr:MjaI family restriction endonuclease [Acidobacteriota bacterium]